MLSVLLSLMCGFVVLHASANRKGRQVQALTTLQLQLV
jgi:hypothetical protein